MNWDTVKGDWKQFSGKVKEKWGNLTDDDLAKINGEREQLEGKLQERYGLAKDEAKKQVDDSLGCELIMKRAPFRARLRLSYLTFLLP